MEQTIVYPGRSKRLEEKDFTFIDRLCRDVGCHVHVNSSGSIASLKAHDSNIRGFTGVFAYLHKHEEGCYWIATLKSRVDQDDPAIFKSISIDWHFHPTLVHNRAGAWFYIGMDDGARYLDVVKVLKSIALIYL